jgi:hypothetical protein
MFLGYVKDRLSEPSEVTRGAGSVENRAHETEENIHWTAPIGPPTLALLRGVPLRRAAITRQFLFGQRS